MLGERNLEDLKGEWSRVEMAKLGTNPALLQSPKMQHEART
jgi:hypothetical protein